MPWIYLAVCAVGLWFTVNALWPSHRTELIGPSFFAGWLTGELAGFHIFWQAVATGLFIAFGALDAWPGYLGLALTAISWAGLVWMIAIAHRSGEVIEDALRAALGDDYRDEIAPGRAERLASALSRKQLLLPFNLRDRRVKKIKNIRYAEGAGKRHLLDVYTPRERGERAPVLLQIHGGVWVIGDKSQQGLPLMLHLAAEGWVCVANNYRLSPKATFPDHLVDCKQALAWVREHIAEYGGDPDFIVVTGGSAGGHLAALVGLTANDPDFQPGFEHVDTSVAAAVPFYGVYDLVDTFQAPDG
jgi:acetyl esterase/lipase